MSHDTVRDNPYTRGIAKFVSGLTYDDIPDEVRDRIKLLILDSFGCALYAVDLEWSKILMKTLGGLDSSDQCGVWGTGQRISAPHAALINGTLTQGFELDDVHRRGILHVGAVTLPALMAVVETKGGLSGKDFLTSSVAGYEIGPRVGVCMGNEHITQGWHSGATVGVFSAASGAASGLGLTEEQTVHALGVAGTQAAGLMAAQFGGMVKRMHAGRSSQSGLYGALLADQGFTGITDVLESEYGGFCTTFSRSQDRFDLEILNHGFGEVWETMGIALKFYSCVGTNHTTMDALRFIRERRPFGTEDVKEIVIYGSKVTVEHVGWEYKPEGVTSAQLNLPFCVATMLIEGDCFVDQFSEAIVADPDRMAFAQKVKTIEDPEITAKGPSFRHTVNVEVHFNDGTVEKEMVEAARGSEKHFASDADVIEKFEKLASKTLPESQVGELRDAILNIEDLKDAGDIAKLLSKS
ncbi:MAG TPA: MmgE/PrpD family protein [Rhodospirillaceae bacterium]|nr:2-methylcitrate dehydratase [Rhodospirillaceae bacterium]HAA93125.1 MmgE/PrpD family protein [Rhodospirillaceae bacterium]HAT34768.1 MmgE/PrpD family protein [Rhodospirillaceae bacterium]